MQLFISIRQVRPVKGQHYQGQRNYKNKQIQLD